MKLRIWWDQWGELVQKFLALAGSIASLIGLLVLFVPSPMALQGWALALVVSAVICLAIFVLLELLTQRGRRVYGKNDAEGIKKYMHDWIEHGGRVAIWTRDLSWAQNFETRQLLKTKAERNELILCLPKKNDLTDELAAAGAEVCAYGANKLESPASRFTIVFFGRDGSRVAVGRANGNTHVIDEFAASGHPAFYLAEDLIALARGQIANRW